MSVGSVRIQTTPILHMTSFEFKSRSLCSLRRCRHTSMRNMSNTMSSQFGKTVTGATSAGTGAVDYFKALKCGALEDCMAMHQIRGANCGTPGMVLTRDRSCHQCDKCWVGDWSECEVQARTKAVGDVYPITLPKPIQVTRMELRTDAHVKDDRSAQP